MTITLERLAHADINLLRELRNANADAFFDSTYITKEAQEDWWHRYGFDVRRQFYTIWLNKVTPVGFLSVCCIKNVYMPPSYWVDVMEIGNLLLAPAHRGRGIMAAAITEVRRLYDPLTFWVAYVKPTNSASLNVFARQGFIQLEPTIKRKSRQRQPKKVPPTLKSGITMQDIANAFYVKDSPLRRHLKGSC